MATEPIKFGKLTITESDREFSKKFGKDDELFTIRIPLPIEKIQINNSISRAIGGQPINSFDPTDYEFIKLIVTLNRVLVKTPEWWKGADLCLEADLLWKLYNFYLESEVTFSENLKKNNELEVSSK
jgi:hypothetical protein